MGLLRGGRDDDDNTRRFRMREKLLSIGDDFWIEDDEGNRAYRVDGKAARVRETILLRDVEDREVAKIQERKLRMRDTTAIERDGETIATVHKALVGIRDRFAIDIEGGEDLKAHGNVVDHEYEIERDGDTIARVSKKWFRVRDSYGVEISAGEDEGMLLAVTVALEALTDDRWCATTSAAAWAPRRALRALPFGDRRAEAPREVIAWLVGIAVALLVAELLGLDVTGWLSDLWDQIKAVPVGYVVAAVVLQTGQTFFAGLSYYGILRAAYPDQVELMPIVAAYAIGVAINGYLPRTSAPS